MELNEKYKAYQSQLKGTQGLDISDKKLRVFHISIENIFDNIKSHKSSRDFKWLFILLYSLVIIATAIHIGKYSVTFNLIPLFLLLIYWVYYRYTLKKSIEAQANANKEILSDSTENPDNEKLLINRAQYILNGIDVLESRIILIRNQYLLFFPVFTILMIDIIRGPLSIGAFIITVILSIILGGLFWIFYFKNELVDLENASDELQEIQQKLERE
jgi:Ca2+/Na+ antiporter